MCATCGCLESKAPAPEQGVYTCIECDEQGKPRAVEVSQGEMMPDCETQEGGACHWRKISEGPMHV